MLDNTHGYLHPFLNGRTYLYGVGELPRTLTELAMCHLSARIRSTDRWWSKIDCRGFRAYWAHEGATTLHSIFTSSGKVKVNLTPKQVEYVLDELASYASLRDCEGNCEVACFDRIWQTSQSLPSTLLASLEMQATALASPLRTYYETSVDTVDPCSYPLVYGRTPALTKENVLKATSQPESWYYAFSTRFSYLPTAFSISGPTMPCRATAKGYINGVPPHIPSMSENIEAIVSNAIPLFESVLTDLHHDNPLRHRITGGCRYDERGPLGKPVISDGKQGLVKNGKAIEERSTNKPLLILPDIVAEGYQRGLDAAKHRVSLRGRTVNVVVRMTEIYLRPDRPYQGASAWRAEGMLNEHIVACAYICIAANNARPLSIDYRMPVQTPLNSIPGDTEATQQTWGLRQGAPSHQYLGRSTLTPGRIVSFPNIYQTQFSSTSLIDPYKEGSMTVLGLYLMDPDFPNVMDDGEVLTTSSVPPQDIKWLHRALEDYLPIKIPMEIIDNIVDQVDWLMSEEEYKQCAVKMRRERKAFWQTHDQLWFSIPFSAFESF
ncbi:hypothetical protein BDY19DRAFT_879129 [Irpex rosettiformis]|uniref:Uncharacterized protein n=1 Tax=Irpex rosettiformis TaxID=378272 RepID=A0ACB8UJE2_9APHY|nr:hypothetical protein BDY19DRAFT_879129 [Irpex rosettiformis]